MGNVTCRIAEDSLHHVLLMDFRLRDVFALHLADYSRVPAVARLDYLH